MSHDQPYRITIEAATPDGWARCLYCDEPATFELRWLAYITGDVIGPKCAQRFRSDDRLAGLYQLRHRGPQPIKAPPRLRGGHR